MRLYMSINVAQVAHQLMGVAAVIFKLPAFPSAPFAATVAVFAKGVAASPAIMNDKWSVESVKERIGAQYGGKIPRRFRLPYFGGKSYYSYSGPSRVEVDSELADDVVKSKD